MRGKIFADSANLYQDEARILFNYYKRAAEKIVQEEMELEKSIEDARARIEQAKKEKIKGIVITAAFPVAALAAVFLVFYSLYAFVIALGSIWGVVTLLNAKKTRRENETMIQGFEEAHRDLRRDYRVKKLGVAYVPVATRIPFENKSFAIDHTGSVANTEFSMSVAHKPEELLQSLVSLQNGIQDAPIVEEAGSAERVDTADYSTSVQNITMYDYIGNIDREARNIRYLLNDNDTIRLTLPVIMPESENARFIGEYAVSDPGDKPVVPVFNIDGFREKIGRFYELNNVRQSFENSTSENQIEYYKKLIKQLAESVQILSMTKMNGSAEVIEYANSILSTVLKSAFNQYSPALEAEEIERIRRASFDYQDSVDSYEPFNLKSSSRVKYDLFSTSWVAEDGSRTSMPFGMHQIQEEVLAPVIQNLMAENRIERLKIYNGIKDQKIDYLNQWHRDTEDFYGRNRAEAADLINRMRESYADYIRSLNTYKALQETQNAMSKTRSLADTEVREQDKDAEVIAGFEVLAAGFNQKQVAFSEYMDRLKENIDEKAAQFGFIPYYEATLRDKESRDFAQSTEGLQELDLRRKRLLAVSPYVAKFAELPPEPRVEQQAYDDFAIDLVKEARELAREAPVSAAEPENRAEGNIEENRDIEGDEE
ncbi:MAG: hypothetical protein LBG27_03720 [Spirochaetaceae bacterium]|jgi:hypothetical protein|nr:hypothetical protein [Spirochaetaceae bacterium]